MSKGRYSTYVNGKFMDIATVDEICDSIRERIESAERQAEFARAEMEKLNAEKWKDETLQKIKAELKAVREDAYRGFPISASEAKAIADWEEQHWAKQHNATTAEQRLLKTGAIGGAFHYDFVPTSIGVAGSVYCGACMSKAREAAYKEISKPESNSRFTEKLQKWINEYDAEFEFQSL